MSLPKCALTCGNKKLTQGCFRGNGKFPKDCPTCTENEILDSTLSKYTSNKKIKKIFNAAAKVESAGYCKWTRVQEALEFAKIYEAKRIGIASCVGLMEESLLLEKLFENHGFEVLSACCKAGAFDKTKARIPEEDKIRPGNFEAICNPIAQAEFCNKYKTDLNFIMGLCIGHDALFTMHSKAPSSTIVVKDRVTGHNPAAVFHTANTYYKSLFGK
ncbi:MAG: DUF1847 domain-containing protein [Candidatus Schekmanbacteria bacterium]|nr:MAG: DUF1847 domain-containing protein [Candidatus Schekmanbacteria bacterium]